MTTRYDKKFPNCGGGQSAVTYARNTGAIPRTWERFQWMNMLRGEMYRALKGIDPPTAWCGDRNGRLRRYLNRIRLLPAPRLP